jgi:hypothetical protein
MRRVLTLCILVLLAGCETSEVRELRRIRAALEVELAAKRSFAETLNRHRRDREALERRLAESQLEAPLAVAAPAGPWKPLASRELTGDDGAKALEHVRALPDASDYALGSLEIGADGRWKAVLVPVRAPPAPPPATVAPRAPVVLPAQSFLSGAEGAQLRMQVLRLDSEIAALERIGGEVAQLGAAERALKQRLELLEVQRRGRLDKEGIADALFAGARPLLRSGQLSLDPGGVTVSGVLAPGKTLEDVRAAVPGELAVVTLEKGEGGKIFLEAKPRR